MKKILSLLLVICMSTFSAGHAYAHINSGGHGAHAHEWGDEHARSGHDGLSAEAHEHHSDDTHNHLDSFFRVPSRQYKALFTALLSPEMISNQPGLKPVNAGLFSNSYQASFYYNSPKIFRNLPLRV